MNFNIVQQKTLGQTLYFENIFRPVAVLGCDAAPFSFSAFLFVAVALNFTITAPPLTP
jgi:hypothetical protein